MSYYTDLDSARNADNFNSKDKDIIAYSENLKRRYNVYFTRKGKPHLTPKNKPYVVIRNFAKGIYYNVYFKSAPKNSDVSTHIDVTYHTSFSKFDNNLCQDFRKLLIDILDDDMKNIDREVKNEREEYERRKHNKDVSRETLTTHTIADI